MAFLHGVRGKAKCNATTLNITAWTIKQEVDLDSVLHSGSNAQQVYITGAHDITVDLEMNWDDAAEPVDSDKPGIPANALTNLKLYYGASTTGALIDTAVIQSIEVSSKVTDPLTYKAIIKKNSTTAIDWAHVDP